MVDVPFLTTALCGVALLVAVKIYRHLTQNSSHLTSLGVPIAPPMPWRMHQYNARDAFMQLMKKYGRAWGQFSGIQPHLYLTDPKLINDVLVKNFDAFLDRQHFPRERKYASLIDERYPDWKPVRKALSPTFTSGKLKSMFGPMGSVADRMVSHIEAKMGNEGSVVLDMKRVFQCLSLDSISNCAFGINTDSFDNPDNKLFQMCLENFTNVRFLSLTQGVLFRLVKLFPGGVMLIVRSIRAVGRLIKGKEDTSFLSVNEYLRKTTEDIAESRLSLGDSSRGDFVDRLNELRRDGQLNDLQAFAQGIGFFQAGFETSSNTLSTLAYNLAKHQDIQDKIYHEVLDVLQDCNDVIDHDSVAKMSYMDAAIQENLRMFPPVIRFNRTCLRESTIGADSGHPLTVKPGTVVNFPVWAIHRHPQLYPHPETFDPHRFTGKQDSTKFLSFGGGPRTCIGMRFAMAEMKISLAKLLFRFRLAATDQTRLDFCNGDLFFLSYPEVKVKLIKRN